MNTSLSKYKIPVSHSISRPQYPPSKLTSDQYLYLHPETSTHKDILPLISYSKNFTLKLPLTKTPNTINPKSQIDQFKMCHAIRTSCTSCNAKYFSIETRCDGVLNGIMGSVIGCTAPDPAWKTIELGIVKNVDECADCTTVCSTRTVAQDLQPRENG